MSRWSKEAEKLVRQMNKVVVEVVDGLDAETQQGLAKALQDNESVREEWRRAVVGGVTFMQNNIFTRLTKDIQAKDTQQG